jgi:hypothetical protein
MYVRVFFFVFCKLIIKKMWCALLKVVNFGVNMSVIINMIPATKSFVRGTYMIKNVIKQVLFLNFYTEVLYPIRGFFFGNDFTWFLTKKNFFVKLFSLLGFFFLVRILHAF